MIILKNTLQISLKSINRIFMLILAIAIISCTKGVDDEPTIDPVDKSKVEIYYSLMSLESVPSICDYTISYTDNNGELKVLNNPSLPWEASFVTKVPFRASMIIDAKLKSDFANAKDYYRLGYNYSMQYTREHNGSYKLSVDNNSVVIKADQIEDGISQYFPMTFELDVPVDDADVE